jgi:hypothetical protein
VAESASIAGSSSGVGVVFGVHGQGQRDVQLTQHGNGPIQVDYEHYKPTNPKRPMMPIGFSVAAYRFGNGTVNASYTVGPGTVAALFGDPSGGDDLSGSRPIPARPKIDWRTFFQVPDAPAPANASRRIDCR